MLKELLKSVILSQQEWLAEEENEIPREQFEDFTSLSPFGYILTGVRRCGKSTLLKQMMRHYGVRNYLNFEDTRLAGFELRDFLTLESLYSEIFKDNSMLFFDEIQNIRNWERYARDAIDRKKTVIITGSNASLLSGEMGTKLTGRHLDFEVFPFSYHEFLRFFGLEANADSFRTYLINGGFPGYLNMGRKEVLSTLVSDILIRDIFARYNLRNQEVYKMIVQFLLSNVGKEVSFNNIKNVFDLGSPSSAMEFLNYLVNAYMIFLVPRYATSLKVQAKNPRKVYGIDQGLVNYSSVSGSPDHGRLLENTVFLYLRRNHKDIWYFRGKKECDFIYSRQPGHYSVLQVSWDLGHHNEKREIAGLLEAMEQFNLQEASIITFDQEDKINASSKTIKLIPGWKWMTDVTSE